jgi:membrane-bound lytic murein transglycosylase A
MAGSRFSLTAVLLLALLAGCSRQQPPPALAPPAAPPPPDRLGLIPIAFNQLPGWNQDRLAEALPALRRSCDKILQLPGDRAIGNDGIAGIASDWNGACGALRWLKADDETALRDYLQNWFRVVKVGNGHGDAGRFTGYYEAELHGSRHPSAKYHVPLLARPAGWPAEPGAEGAISRAAIEAGALKDKAMPVLWVDDAVDAHILQIQGSGRIDLDDGSQIRVGYAGNNGLPFIGLGKILKDHGKITDTTMPAVRAWLKSHPAEAPALMAQNPRYVFFRTVQGEGPVGAFGVVLTAARSLAIDPHFIPLGAPVWLDTIDPDGIRLQRLVVAQDIGSAIKGAVRGDLYWGSGEAAFEKAGRMNSRGSYYLLLPSQHSSPVALNLPSDR